MGIHCPKAVPFVFGTNNGQVAVELFYSGSAFWDFHALIVVEAKHHRFLNKNTLPHIEEGCLFLEKLISFLYPSHSHGPVNVAVN
ncbi:hypothetical protein PEDI_15470 [Persicobacter diffluens]|uniref:Uncharacterized protein n=1 Tax=Persicobacter diffluens TaxID=981 RepID=A0AAN4VZ29_9BACT|nr:hypothetical protein PEDI_15470 [Persicobacter diffluens]